MVAVLDGKVVASAWTSQYRPRACYESIAEFSVYVDRSWRGKRLGRAVMQELIQVAERRGFTKLVSRIFPENEASRALCQSLGFREVGTYERHGKLEGLWKDCVIVEKLLGAAARAE